MWSELVSNFHCGVFFFNLSLLAIGIVIGVILGDIRSDIRHTEEKVNRLMNQRGEGGFFRLTMQGVAFFLIVVIVATSAFLSAATLNKTNDNTTALAQSQEARDRENNCTSKILFKAIKALNERSKFSSAQSKANLILQRSQFKLVTTIINPDLTEEEGAVIFNEYVEALSAYLVAVQKVLGSQKAAPYPTKKQYTTCLKEARAQTAKDERDSQ